MDTHPPLLLRRRPAPGREPPPPGLPRHAGFLRALDGIASRLDDWPDAIAAMRDLFELTRRMRNAALPGWRDAARAHPIAAMLRQDPFTDWAWRRPRGYPGDAGLMDFPYGHARAAPALLAATRLGRRLHDVNFSAATCVAARERRRLLAQALDEAVTRTGRPDILAVASGHMRELDLAASAARAGRIVALDQDEASLAELLRCHGGLGNLEAVPARIGRLIARPDALGRFDLIYAAGLFDYLEAETAARLTAALVQALKPGGRLLIGNFATPSADAGYMDAFMDWRLILRTEPDVMAFAERVPAAALARRRLFRGTNRNLIYLLLERRAAA